MVDTEVHIEPQRPYVGAHIILIQDNSVLLMRRTVRDSMEGQYAFPAGKVDQYESPRAALVREAMEEIGVTIIPDDMTHILTLHHAQSDYRARKEDVIEFYFTVKKWSGVPHILEPDKCDQLAFYPLDNLPQPVPDGVRFALASLKNGGPSFIEN